jgi:hypothetical protein
VLAARRRPVRDHEIAVGARCQRPHLVGEAQVVADERADPQVLDRDRDALAARGEVLLLTRVRERVDLVVVVERAVR